MLDQPTAAAARRRVALLAIVILVTSLAGVLVGLLYPDADADGQFSYARVEPIRDFFWAWHVFAGTNLALGIPALAIAGWLLVPARGSGLATVGGAMMWVGTALYGVGLGGLATVFYFGSARDAIGAEAGTRLLDHVNDQVARLYGPLLAGAALVALGTVMLAVALWRARSVPRWVPVLLATIPLTFVLPTSGLVGLVVELPTAIGSIALGWYAWRRTRSEDAARASDDAGHGGAKPSPISLLMSLVSPSRKSPAPRTIPTTRVRSITSSERRRPTTFSRPARAMCPPSKGSTGSRLMSPSESEISASTCSTSGGSILITWRVTS